MARKVIPDPRLVRLFSSLTLPVSFRLSSFLRSPPLARRARDRCAASGRVRGKWSEESQETG